MSNNAGRSRISRTNNFSFITYENEADLKQTPQTRKAVRSHVTRVQHRRARISQPDAIQGNTHRPAGSGRHVRVEGNDGNEAAAVDEKGNVQPPSGRGARARFRASQPARGILIARIPREDASTTTHLGSFCNAIPSPALLVQAATIEQRAVRETMLDDPTDHIAAVLGRLQLDFATVLGHYKWIVWAQSPDWQRIFAPELPPGVGSAELLGRLSEDPALVATAALISTGHILTIRHSRMTPLIARCIWELRSFVTRTINDALRDPERGTCDALIGAVLILATHEGLQGNANSYHIHMRGLVQMINLRGGLVSLNKRQQYLESMVKWQDANVSAVMGNEQTYYSLCDNPSPDLPEVTPCPALWPLADYSSIKHMTND